MGKAGRRSRLLFVTYGGGHIDIVVRLLPWLDRLEDVEVRILALTTAAPRLEQTEWKFKRCIDYLPLSGYEKAMEIGRELSQNLVGVTSGGKWDDSLGISFEETCAYLGVSMVDLIGTSVRTRRGKPTRKKDVRRFVRAPSCAMFSSENARISSSPPVIRGWNAPR